MDKELLQLYLEAGETHSVIRKLIEEIIALQLRVVELERNCNAN